MNGETLFLMLLGHCIADFMFQPASLAFNKKEKSWYGFRQCTIHCVMYTTIVITTMHMSSDFMNLLDKIGIKQALCMWGLIFSTHYFIDRFHFVEWWVKKTKTRSWDTHVNIIYIDENAKLRDSINVSFGSIVYVMIDNTIHLLLMYLTFKYFYSII